MVSYLSPGLPHPHRRHLHPPLRRPRRQPGRQFPQRLSGRRRLGLPEPPGELADDEIAIGDCLLKMAAYVEGGPPVYPLEEACQDRYLDILIQQAQETGQTITAETQAWAG